MCSEAMNKHHSIRFPFSLNPAFSFVSGAGYLCLPFPNSHVQSTKYAMLRPLLILLRLFIIFLSLFFGNHCLFES